MLREAIEAIRKLAVEATEAGVVHVPGDGRTVFLQHGETVERFEVAPACRKHVVYSLDDLIDYTEQVAPRGGEETGDTVAPPTNGKGGPILWHGPKGVTLVIDDSDRRDSVHFGLSFSRRFESLQKLEREPKMLDQRQFVILLRFDLGLANEPIVVKFRKLDWKVANEGRGEVGHGSDRMGKTISAEVQGIDKLPEDIDVLVPVYAECGERDPYMVRCNVEIDAVNMRLALIPQPEELQAAIDQAQANIRKRLDANFSGRVPIYYGTP